MDEQAIQKIVERTLRTEIDGVTAAVANIGSAFGEAANLLLATQGKVIVIGVGKSGLIGQKIAATLSSTGTPALFLHPGEALHGDLGVIQPQDRICMLSNSGSSGEIAALLPAIRAAAIPIVAITGHAQSVLGRAANVVLCTGDLAEACPLGLAPTTSTTAALVIGDILAVLLMEMRGFGKADFAEVHPAGALGRELLRVADVMRTESRLPIVSEDATFNDVVKAVDQGGIGAVAVVNEERTLSGVITDGDIRRAIKSGPDCFQLLAKELMGRKPKQVGTHVSLGDALARFERFRVSTLFAVDSEQHPVGVLHLHDAMEGRKRDE